MKEPGNPKALVRSVKMHCAPGVGVLDDFQRGERGEDYGPSHVVRDVVIFSSLSSHMYANAGALPSSATRQSRSSNGASPLTSADFVAGDISPIYHEVPIPEESLNPLSSWGAVRRCFLPWIS